MSEGPIKRAREAWKPTVVSTTAKDRVCRLAGGRGYCGRRSAPTSKSWDEVSCADCHAARRADLAVVGKGGV